MTKQLSENDVQGDSKFNRIALVQEVAEIVRNAFKKRWKHTHVGMETSYAIARDILAAMPPQPVDGELLEALIAHHQWHLNRGTEEIGGMELDMSLEYYDSSLYERTVVAIAKARNNQPGDK